jgi:hypothetical protein
MTVHELNGRNTQKREEEVEEESGKKMSHMKPQKKNGMKTNILLFS